MSERTLLADAKFSAGQRDAVGENINFMAFCERFGEATGVEVMERIADAMWSREGAGIRFSDVYQHNACNHTASGTIEHAGESFGFIIESGDRNGTVIHEWGPAEDVGVFEHPKPILYTFVPRDDDLQAKRPEMYRVYLLWAQQEWFKEKARAYNYDKHFAPGCKTERYYSEWAAQKGLKIRMVES